MANADLGPKTWDPSSKTAEAGQFLLKANGAWLDLVRGKVPYTKTNEKGTSTLYFVPLEEACAALDIAIDRGTGSVKLERDGIVSKALIYTKGGVEFLTTSYLEHVFGNVGLSVTVRLNAGSADSGTIQVDMRTPRPYVVTGENGTYEYVAGEHSYDGVTMPYRMAEHMPRVGEKAALVVLLHGASSCGRDNEKQLKSGGTSILDYFAKKGENCVVVVPQADLETWSYYKYVIVDLMRNMAKTNENIDPKRLYVTGISMGGGGTWQVVDAAPDLIAAALPAAHYAEVEEDYIGDFALTDPVEFVKVENLKDVPFLIVAGENDEMGGGSDTSMVEKSYKRLVEAGAEVRYEILPGATHSVVCRESIANTDFLDWVFSHTK